jgi:hypothetical protein
MPPASRPLPSFRIHTALQEKVARHPGEKRFLVISKKRLPNLTIEYFKHLNTMKFKALLQTGLACLLAATLSAPAYAEEIPQAISQDTPLPGDFQAAPAARPTKPNTAQPQAAPQPAATKQRTITRKHASKPHSKHRASKKPTSKSLVRKSASKTLAKKTARKSLIKSTAHKALAKKPARKASAKKAAGKRIGKPRKTAKNPPRASIKKLTHKKRKAKR